MPVPEDPAEEPPVETPGATTPLEDATGKKNRKGKGKKGKNNKQQDEEDEDERKQQDLLDQLEREAEAEQTPAETPGDYIPPPSFPEPHIPSAIGGFGLSSYSQGAAGGGGDDWGFDPSEDDPQHEAPQEPPKSPRRSPYRAPQDLASQWAGDAYVPLDSQAPVHASPKPSPSRAAAQLPTSQFNFSQPVHSAATRENNWFDPPSQSPSKTMHPLPHTAVPVPPSPRRSPIQIPQELHTRPTGGPPRPPRPPPVPIEGLATTAEALVHQYAPDPTKYQERIIQVRAPERAKPEDSEFLRRVGGNVKPDVVFLRRHFHGEGKLSESQAIWILEKAAEIFQSEQNVLDLEAPITSKSLSSCPDALPY